MTVYLITQRDLAPASPWSSARKGTTIVRAGVTTDPIDAADLLATWHTPAYPARLHEITKPGDVLSLAWGAMHPIAVEVISRSSTVWLDSSQAWWWLPSDTLLATGTIETWTAAALDDLGFDPGTATRAEMFDVVRDLPRLALWRSIYDIVQGPDAFVGIEARGGAVDRTVAVFGDDHFIIAARGYFYRYFYRQRANGEFAGLTESNIGDAAAPGAAALLSALGLGLYVWTWSEPLDAHTDAAGIAFASQPVASFPEPFASRFAGLDDFTEIAP